jgi:parallel beta-helix repeat protein
MKQMPFRKKIALWLLCSFVINIVAPLYAATSEHAMKMAQTAVANRSGYVDVSPQNIAGMDLKQVLRDIMMRAESEGMLDQLPQGIERCCVSLQTSMYVHRADLEEAMPFIIRSLVPADMIDESGNVRAMRPTPEQGAPIVGAATCDLTPVLKAISCLRALIIREFNETWTILANIEQELLECCSQIHAEFNATWTILNQIEVDLAECCSQIHADFNATWTILATLGDDSSQTWTMIQACCDEISNDFDATWTILNQIEIDLNACCTQSSENFNNTWTILANIDSEIRDTWTMIQNCCDEISRDFESTWTILARLQNDMSDCCTQTQENFNNTWTILSNIDDEFRQTWTMIQNCCDEISRDFSGTWTILADLTPCGAIPLSQDDVVGDVLLISTPGSYCLASDIVGLISIQASGVTLDLNGHTAGAIEADGQQDIVIKKGFINGNAGGLFPASEMLLTTCTSVHIDHVDFNGDGSGLSADDVTILTVNNTTFRNHFGFAIQLSNVRNSTFNDIIAENNSSALFGLFSAPAEPEIAVYNMFAPRGPGGTTAVIDMDLCTNCVFTNVLANNNNVLCVWSVSNSDNMVFSKCQANNTTAINGALVGIPHGMWSVADSTNSNFVECQANDNFASNETGSFLQEIFAGFLFQRCSSIALNTCQANGSTHLPGTNGATAGIAVIDASMTVAGASRNIVVRDCEVSSNTTLVGTSTVFPAMVGFVSVGNSDIHYDGCIAHANMCETGVCFGFIALGGEDTSYARCTSDRNGGALTQGFFFNDQHNIAMTECFALSNTGVGIGLDRCSSVVISDTVSESNLQEGIAISGSSHSVSIERCFVSSNTGAGISIFDSDTINIVDSTAEFNLHGIQAAESDAISIARSSATSNRGAGMRFAICDGLNITGNAIQLNEDRGVYVESSTSVSVQQNSLLSNDGGGIIVLRSDTVEVVNNPVQNNLNDGIHCENVRSLVTRNNVVQAHELEGMFIATCTGVSIEDSSSISNGRRGIDVVDSKAVAILNNTVQDNGSVGIRVLTSESVKIVDNTVQSNNGDGVFVSTSTQVIAQGNVSQFNSEFGINNLGAPNAYFTNQAQGNLSGNYPPGFIPPVVTYNQGTGTFSATPTPYDNIDII